MFDDFMGEKSHQSQKTLMKCSLYHSGEKVGVVVIGDKDNDFVKDRVE